MLSVRYSHKAGRSALIKKGEIQSLFFLYNKVYIFLMEVIYLSESKDLDLVEIKDNQIVVSSLQIAEHFGKEHNHVLRDIRKELGYIQNWTDPSDAKMFIETTYVHPQNGQEYPILL